MQIIPKGSHIFATICAGAVNCCIIVNLLG